ncbi:MAG: DUF924 family protein [Variovorax sp.]
MNAAASFKRARAYTAADARGTAVDAADVVRFWRAARADWFSHDPAFDRRFRERFLDLHLSAARRQRDDWADTPEGSLALLILLDQFPRNAFRNTGHMYATDALALHFARMADAAGYINVVDSELRLFFCLPFAHSEDVADQVLSVELNTRLGPAEQSHAEGHRDIIRRFGRFPHRNPLLLRETTAEEQAFLDRGGFAG